MRGHAKDGKGSLYIRFHHCNRMVLVPLKIRLAPSEWKDETVVNRPDSKELNALIARKQAEVDIRLINLRAQHPFDWDQPTGIRLINYLLYGKAEKDRYDRTVTEMFDEYTNQPMAEGSKTIYKAAQKKVENYAGKDAKMKDIDYRWLVGFENFMATTQSINGRAIYLRHLKAVCHYAVKTGVISRCPFDTFSIHTEPTEKRNISIELLREFYKFPVDKAKARYRDYFFLMFYLIGINAVDLLRATPDMVQNGRMVYRRTKTHKPLSIKIQPEAQAIIDKYRGEHYLLDALDNVKNYKNFLHRMNDALKQIGPIVLEEKPAMTLFDLPVEVAKTEPIVPDITTYYARHTWATIAFKIGISSDIVGLALGHSSRARVTWIYIEPDMTQVDEANRKVIDYFFEGLKD